MRKIFTGSLLVLVSLYVFGKSSENTKAVVANKANVQIALDGKLTEPIWKSQPVDEFTQKDPNEGSPSTEKTEVWVAYDEANIYIGARLHDSKPDSIDAKLDRRDNYFSSDWFAFYVDPYNDKKSGYFFAVNAGGTILDGTLFNDSWDDWSWDGIWESNTSVDEVGWTVEMKIPFSQMRFNQAEKMTWGVNFYREIKKNNEKSYFVMVPKKESGFVSKFASLEGLSGIKPAQRFELLPYLVQKASYLVHESNDPFYKRNQYKTAIGADLKVGIGTNLNLDVTLNPDFGQVEVDPAVVNLSAFETYFEEKRPFFIEGSNLFYFGIGGATNNWGFNFGWPELFYSRRIGRTPQGSTTGADYTDYPSETRILGAAKLTGKIDENFSVAALSAVTERTFATLWNSGLRNEEEVEPFTHYGVLRGKKEFNDGKQALGFMVTSTNRNLQDNELKNNLSQNAFAFGTDGWTFLDEDQEYVLTGAFAGTYVQGTKEYIQELQKQPIRYFQRPDATYATFDPERTSLSGWYGRMMLNKQKGEFYLNAALGAISPGFEQNDLGFQWMADRINAHVVTGYRWFDPDSIFRRKSIYVAYAKSYDFEGDAISNFLWFNSNFTLMNYYGFSVGGNYSFETYNRSLTRGGPLMIQPSEYSLNFSAYSDSREKIIFELNGYVSKDKMNAIYYEVETGIEWRPNSQLTFSIGPSYTNNDEKRQWIGNFEDPTATNTFGNRYVFGRIKQDMIAANIRLNWTFTPTLSLQMFLQPLLAVGKYNEFKELAKPGTNDLNYYDKSGAVISYNTDNDEYFIDPDGDGASQGFTFSNRDFNFKSLRGNIVLRWEVMPGSVFYLVWSHDQSNFDDPGTMNLKRDFKNLISSEGNDILMAKFSYWFDM
ncbi:MAG: DUF5916 domain-containing protein [bacterium]